MRSRASNRAGPISPAALESLRGPGSRRHSPPALEVLDGAFRGRVGPHVQLRRLEAVKRKDRADLRTVIAPVMRELSERHPELHIHLAPLVVDLLIEVDVFRLEQLLDRVANAGETGRDLVNRCRELYEWLRDRAVGVEVTLVRSDDVGEGLLDRAICTGRGELPLLGR